MRVSIVTISFNQGRFLERCIRSVIEQDYEDIEYIVVDPGSTDGSREIIERYRDCIDHIIFEPDNGPADGLNKGFSKANGDIFGYINADDYLLPGAITEVVAAFKKRNADVISGHGYVVDDCGRLQYREFSWIFSLDAFLTGCGTVVQQATFFRSSMFKHVGGFNAENKNCWDGELMVDMALAGAKFNVINKFLASFRLHEGSITGSGRLESQYRQTIEQLRTRVLASYRPAFSHRSAFFLLNRLKNPWALGFRLVDSLLSRRGRMRWRGSVL